MAEVEIAGAKIKGGKIMLILPLLGTLGGGLWGGFEFYKDYMDMKEIIQNIDIDSIQSENTLVQTKLDKAIDYTRDIKDDLREDILKLEGYIDKMDSKVEKSIDSVRETKLLIDATLENMLTANNELQKDTTASLREVESLNRETEKDVRNTLRETEERIASNMRKLEDKLIERLQEALDNPLSD
jgi:hypothetical protein